MSRADDDYDDRPRRRPRDDDDDYDDRPRRGRASGGGGAGAAAGMSVMVIVGLVVGGMVCCGGVGIALLLPAVQKVREAAARAKDMNNYKEVSLAVHKHHDVNGRFPPADGAVSWRVHVLPGLNQNSLYGEFDTAQPWDGAKNRRQTDTRVDPFVSVLDDGPPFAQTRERVFTGPGTLFPPAPMRARFIDVTDGLANTIMLAEAADTVPWPQPRELPLTKDGPLPQLGHPQRRTGFIVAFGDGSVRFVRESSTDAARRAAIVINDGAPMQLDF